MMLREEKIVWGEGGVEREAWTKSREGAKKGVGEERGKDVDTVPGIIDTKMTYVVLGGSLAKV